MNIKRGLLTSAALAGLLSLTLTGCKSADSADSTAAKAAADPKAALAASTTGLKAGNYAFSFDMPETKAVGVVHQPSHSASLDLDSAAMKSRVEIRLVGTDRWMKTKVDTKELTDQLKGMDLSNPAMAKLAASMKDTVELYSGKVWMHIDLTTPAAANDLGLTLTLTNPDVTGASALLGAVVTAQGDGHTVTGTLDATKVAAGKVGAIDSDEVKKMGTAATALPYTAVLDDQGRLSSLELAVPKAGTTPAGKWVIKVTGYGAQVAQVKPTGKIKNMSANDLPALKN